METKGKILVLDFVVLAVVLISGVKCWTGEIHGRVVCDVCADSSIGPEDHVLEGGVMLPHFNTSIAIVGEDLCYSDFGVSVGYGISDIGAEVAVLCITKSGEVVNYQAFTNSKGIYTVAETMPQSDRWDACLVRPISSFHDHCDHLREGSTGVKFTYNRPSGHFHNIRPFVYRPSSVPTYCI